MRRSRCAIVGFFVLTAAVLAGCTPEADDTNGSATTSGAPATATSAARVDATACRAIHDDIENAVEQVAEAKKIGPPAGHSAVSAQYSASAAAMLVHTFTPSTEVNDAAKQVADAMSDLAEEYATDPRKEPGTAALDAAVTQLRAACPVS
jgi:hypothetical protein